MSHAYFPNQQASSNMKVAIARMTAQLWGHRFFGDQTTFELMSEFLLIASSPKQIINTEDSDGAEEIESYFLEPEQIEHLSEAYTLAYRPHALIGLKLFAIFANSELSSLDGSGFAEKYKNLLESFKDKVTILPGAKVRDTNTAADVLSNLFLGYQGIGGNRDWVAQSFLPIRKELLACETIYRKSKGKGKGAFSHSDHDFYARGGEILYLQVLAALGKKQEEIVDWLRSSGFDECYNVADSRNINPTYLRTQLSKGLKRLLEDSSPVMIGKLAAFIDQKNESQEENITLKMGYIPTEEWKLGYLFIQDLIHIFATQFDAIEWLQMLEIACTMQLLRTMHHMTLLFYKENHLSANFHYLGVIDPTSRDVALKQVSSLSLKNIQYAIRTAIEKICLKELGCKKEDMKKDYNRYGDKVFLKNAKNLGFVVPPKGSPEHFVLNKVLLTYLVVSTLGPGEKMSIDTFLRQLEIRFGIVCTHDGLNKIAIEGGSQLRVVSENPEQWMLEMLEESGSLIVLADSLSIVTNAMPKVSCEGADKC